MLLLLSVLKTEYDHLCFPSLIYRSFIGAVVIARLSRPSIAVTSGLVNEQGQLPALAKQQSLQLDAYGGWTLMSYAKLWPEVWAFGTLTQSMGEKCTIQIDP